MDTKSNRPLLLLIEDNETYRKALEQKLVVEDFDVLTAQDGEEGLKLALDKHPVFIAVDLMLTKMNGAVFLSKLREDEWGRDVPVMVLTNISPDDETMQKIMNHKPC